MSFRAKLLLAMMLVVAGVTVATLFATQQRMQSTYDRLFQDQFESQVDFFAEKQDARLRRYQEHLLTLAASPRIRAALEEDDVADVFENAYVEFERAGLPVLKTVQVPDPKLPVMKRAMKSLGQPFVRFINASGRILHPPDGRGGVPHPAGRQRLEKQLAFVSQAITKLEQQQLGYMAPEIEPGKTEISEVIVTRIQRPDGQPVGAIVLGFPLPDLGERALNAMIQLETGIWLDGEIHSTTMSTPVREMLARRLGEEIEDSPDPRDEFTIDVEGTPHRVFYRLLNPDSPLPPAYQVCLYSLLGAVQAQADLRIRILLLGGAALLVAFALSLLIAHSLSTPIRELVAGTVQIKRGNFAAEAPVRSRDELGQLAGSFNEMADGLALKEKYHNVLNMVTDRDVADQLMNGSVALGGERRVASILFCDIRGFTALTQDMPPERVISLLNEHMTALTKVVHEHRGVVDKFVGDLIMAVFGAPRSYGRDAERAVQCALRMIEERGKLNENAVHKIQIGIGIATGEVVAGCMGSSDRIDYTVLGARVNLASRLCGQAAPGKIVIGESTREELGGAVVVEPLSPLVLKGFADPVQAYELIEFRAQEVRA